MSLNPLIWLTILFSSLFKASSVRLSRWHTCFTEKKNSNWRSSDKTGKLQTHGRSARSSGCCKGPCFGDCSLTHHVCVALRSAWIHRIGSLFPGVEDIEPLTPTMDGDFPTFYLARRVSRNFDHLRVPWQLEDLLLPVQNLLDVAGSASCIGRWFTRHFHTFFRAT